MLLLLAHQYFIRFLLYNNSKEFARKEIYHRLRYHLCQPEASTTTGLVTFVAIYLILDPIIESRDVCIDIGYPAGSAVTRASRNNTVQDIVTCIEKWATRVAKACLEVCG